MASARWEAGRAQGGGRGPAPLQPMSRLGCRRRAMCIKVSLTPRTRMVQRRRRRRTLCADKFSVILGGKWPVLEWVFSFEKGLEKYMDSDFKLNSLSVLMRSKPSKSYQVNYVRIYIFVKWLIFFLCIFLFCDVLIGLHQSLCICNEPKNWLKLETKPSNSRTISLLLKQRMMHPCQNNWTSWRLHMQPLSACKWDMNTRWHTNMGRTV